MPTELTVEHSDVVSVVEDDDRAGLLTPEEWEDLEWLRALQRHAPEMMTPRSWATLSGFEARIRAYRQKQTEEHCRRWLPTLSPQKATELERKVKANEPLTPNEEQQWIAVVEGSKPISNSASAFDRWNERPIVESLFTRSSCLPRMRQTRAQSRRRPSARRRTSRSSRSSPGRSTGDDGPLPLASSHGLGRALPRVRWAA
jgi:hypothetical protein